MNNKHIGFLEQINNMMEKNKDVHAIEKLWVEMKKHNEEEALVKKDLLEEEYKNLYPEVETTEIKVGGIVIDTIKEKIKYIEYDKEKEVPVLDENGDPIIDPETGDIKTELKPVIPDEYYETDDNGEKVLKAEYAESPLRPTLKYFIKKSTEQLLEDIKYDINMDQFVPFIKPYMIKLVNVEFSKAMNVITSKYPEHEQMTWDQQEQEARAYKADPKNAKTPLISNIAKARGVDLDTLADKIIAKAEAYKQAAGLAIGYRQEAEDVISAIATYEDYQKVVAGLEAKRDLFYKVVEGK